MQAATADHMQIRTVLERYFYAIDRREAATVASCFTDDATALHHKGFPTEVLLDTPHGIASFLLQRTAVYSATTHVLGNLHVTVSGETAHAQTHAVAYCVVQDQGRILVRGIRYEDELVRAAGWQIRRRLHVPVWQYEVAAVQPAIPVPGEARR